MQSLSDKKFLVKHFIDLKKLKQQVKIQNFIKKRTFEKYYSVFNSENGNKNNIIMEES